MIFCLLHLKYYLIVNTNAFMVSFPVDVLILVYRFSLLGLLYVLFQIVWWTIVSLILCMCSSCAATFPNIQEDSDSVSDSEEAYLNNTKVSSFC